MKALWARQRHLWLRAALWLLVLAPFFFVTYGQVNQFTLTRDNVGSMAFSWEHHIPFLPWTIIPYWSLDLLYGLALFVCTSRRELNRLAAQLVLASLFACIGFLLFPLRFSFVRPDVTGMFGWLFQQLDQFDLPFNQSPSLHIILCWLLWCHYRRHLGRVMTTLNTAWFALIAVSVLTTWQHHVVDVVSGLAVGLFISWLVPLQGEWRWRAPDHRRCQLASRYAVGAVLCSVTACIYPVMWWCALALFIVAASYVGLGVQALQKDSRGRLSYAARWLLLPWRWGAWATVRYYMRHLPPVSAVHYGVVLGAYPRQPIAAKAVLDLTSEFPKAPVLVNTDIAYQSVPMLDLTLPSHKELSRGVCALEALRQQHDTVLVHCALGLTRSALVVSAWLLAYQYERSAAEAIQRVRDMRPQILLPQQAIAYLIDWQKGHSHEYG